MEGKREEMGMKGIDDDDQCNADNDDASFFEQHQTYPEKENGEGGDLKAWMREELGQVKKELQDGVIEGRCRCTGKKGNVGAGGVEEGEKCLRTIDD